MTENDCLSNPVDSTPASCLLHAKKQGQLGPKLRAVAILNLGRCFSSSLSALNQTGLSREMYDRLLYVLHCTELVNIIARRKISSRVSAKLNMRF